MKFTPSPFQVAPSGAGRPGQVRSRDGTGGLAEGSQVVRWFIVAAMQLADGTVAGRMSCVAPGRRRPPGDSRLAWCWEWLFGLRRSRGWAAAPETAQDLESNSLHPWEPIGPWSYTSRPVIQAGDLDFTAKPNIFEKTAKEKPVDKPHIRIPVSASTPPTNRHSSGSTRSPYPVVV